MDMNLSKLWEDREGQGSLVLQCMGSQRVIHDLASEEQQICPLTPQVAGASSKESTCNVGDLGSIPGLGRSPGVRNGKPLQYSCLENSMERRNLVGYS